MTALPIEELLTPLSESQPCGLDLEYDPAFMALESAARGTPERESDGTLVAAEPPNWMEVCEAALALSRRTRDLRIAVLLTRAAARTQGLVGYGAGLSLMAQMLDKQWDGVHPQLDGSEGGDATMRLNALAPLCDHAAGLDDLRACHLVAVGHPLTVQLIELAFTKVETLIGQTRPTPAGIAKGLQEAAVADPGLFDRLRSVHATATSIDRTINQRVGIAGPDFKSLLQITKALDQAATVAQGGALAETATGRDAAEFPRVQQAASPGTIQTRDDVVRTLGSICEWIERHEPSNPAPLLIRRAQRLMSKSFIELVRDLAPDGLTQLERIAGAAES
jgi:type VI secretion system protein ImpA